MDDDQAMNPNYSIDIDAIKDEQNPVYQNVDIHRQRLLSVLDRALEKIGIAYVLEEMLVENLSVMRNYLTQREVDSIIRVFKYARRLEAPSTNIMSTVMRRSQAFKHAHLRRSTGGPVTYHRSNASNSSTLSKFSRVSIATCIQQDVDINSDMDKTNEQPISFIRNYYNSIIAKLHFVPEITYLAKIILYKRPIGTIKYYAYLKDLREHVARMVYQTKTEEIDHQKNIKQKYVINQKEKVQAEAVKKILQDKQKEKTELERQIKKEIDKEKLIQADMNNQLLNDATVIINESENKIIARTEESLITQEEKKIVYAERAACYNKEINENIENIQKLRKVVKKLEVRYKKIMENYDNTVGALNEVYETIHDEFVKVEAKYNELKEKFDTQEVIYIELMAERKHYVEMNALRIRYTRSCLKIQRWWREVLCRKWRNRKTYIAIQIRRRSLPSLQRAKLMKALRKIKRRQKEMTKKFKFK